MPRVTPLPDNEPERLKALESYQILDTPEEAVYDAFTRLAREIAGTKSSAISLIAQDRQWFKSSSGLDVQETPRDLAFCSHVVAQGESMVVPDAREDARFRENPYVTSDSSVRFYAGVPLMNPEGFALGTLCVLDDQPREISPSQLASLEELSRVIIGVLEGRRRVLTLFDSAGIDVLTVNPKNHVIEFASRGACERLQYAERELSGKSIYDVVPQLTEEEAAQIDARARLGELTVREGRFRRRDGTTYPVEVRLDMTSERGEERMIVIATDQTRRKEQEREINLLLGAVNVAGDAILVYRVAPDGRLELTYMNDAYSKQTGYAATEAIGRDLEGFRQNMPDDAGMVKVREALKRNVAAQTELISYRKDGTAYWNQVTLHPIAGERGTVTHWICIERDITEEVQRTAQLVEEHDRLLVLSRAMRRLFTALDTRSLTATIREVVRELVPASARVLAVQDEHAIEVSELGHTDWTDAFEDELVQRAVRYQMRVVQEDQRRAAAYVGRFGDTPYVLELRTHASQTLNNTDFFVFDLIAEYFAVAARNVTLYKELDERRSAVLELSQTKSDLIAMLAHDFRGPLTSIVGFADLTSETGSVNEEQTEYLDTIKRSAMQLSDLATDTLTLSRLERNEVTLHVNDVDLEKLMQNVIAQQADGRAVALDVQGGVRVIGDDERLRQVFANLVDNALKYSPGGRPPEVAAIGSDDAVTITVRDYGIGIPAGELSRVFDRFSRASNARKLRISGTGFGLFLTKQLVQLHAGTIAVESAEGQGSMFTVTLPRRLDRRAGPRTVVVLDSERDRSFLGYGVREAGYRVVTAASLDEVLSVADAQPVDALVVAEAESLSNTDAALYRAFTRERNIPLLAVTNDSLPKLGATVMLPHPVLIGDVISALENLDVTATP